MKINLLSPPPIKQEPFRLDRLKFIPDEPGCYVLTTFSTEILYIGLTSSLRRRMKDHLNSPLKTAETPIGRAILFAWLPCKNINTIERTWQNTHLQHEGRLPIMNKIYSPT